MGSGFRTFAASEVLTSSNVQNYLMTQSVMYFASTAARDAAITAPVAGMVAFIDSNDANEGLYVYHGATGGWRKGPGWNAPWGFVASATASANLNTSGTTEATIVSTGSFTAVANRYYLITACTSSYGSTSADVFTMRVRNGSLTGTVLGYQNQSVQVGGSVAYQTASVSFVTTIAAGASAGLFLTTQRTGGSGTNFYNYIASPAYVTITDIGPAGAPA